MPVQEYSLILPGEISEEQYLTAEFFEDGSGAAGSDVQAYHGTSYVKNVKIESQGVEIEGEINGTLRTHDYRALYKVYNLKETENWKVWVAEFKKDTSRDELKKVFEESNMIDTPVKMKFKIKPVYDKVAYIKLGFETIRLEIKGEKKDFTVVNPNSGKGKGENGKDYDVDFEPIK